MICSLMGGSSARNGRLYGGIDETSIEISGSKTQNIRLDS